LHLEFVNGKTKQATIHNPYISLDMLVIITYKKKPSFSNQNKPISLCNIYLSSINQEEKSNFQNQFKQITSSHPQHYVKHMDGWMG
jgi:hypothetical protein